MDVTLSPLFLNVDVVEGLLGVTGGNGRGARSFDQELAYQHQLANILGKEAGNLGIVELQTALLKGDVAPGRVVSVQQAFYFKRTQVDRRPMIKFHGKLDTDGEVLVEGVIDPERFAANSPRYILSGRVSVNVIGQVIDIGEVVRLRALFIGWRAFALTNDERRIGMLHVDRQVFPRDIDNFSPVDWDRPLSKSQLEATANMAEATVKRVIADLLNEFDVDKDWGGEQSDLYSLQVRVHGRQLSSSWLLKGRSVPRAMRIADLGKNGDQIDRLASQRTDLLVVQSNRGQSAAVRNMLAAYAHDMRHPRRYMLVDGHATGALLRHAGEIM